MARTNLFTASVGNEWSLSHVLAWGDNSSSANLRHISYTMECSEDNWLCVVTPLRVVVDIIAGSDGWVEDDAITTRRWAAVRVTADRARRIVVVFVVVGDSIMLVDCRSLERF
jgi:hypothetical protein